MIIIMIIIIIIVNTVMGPSLGQSVIITAIKEEKKVKRNWRIFVTCNADKKVTPILHY